MDFTVGMNLTYELPRPTQYRMSRERLLWRGAITIVTQNRANTDRCVESDAAG